MLETRFIKKGGNLDKPDGIAASFATWNPEVFDKETHLKKIGFQDTAVFAVHPYRDDSSHMDRPNFFIAHARK